MDFLRGEKIEPSHLSVLHIQSDRDPYFAYLPLFIAAFGQVPLRGWINWSPVDPSYCASGPCRTPGVIGDTPTITSG